MIITGPVFCAADESGAISRMPAPIAVAAMDAY
jgi:hypothetical protein